MTVEEEIQEPFGKSFTKKLEEHAKTRESFFGERGGCVYSCELAKTDKCKPDMHCPSLWVPLDVVLGVVAKEPFLRKGFTEKLQHALEFRIFNLIHSCGYYMAEQKRDKMNLHEAIKSAISEVLLGATSPEPFCEKASPKTPCDNNPEFSCKYPVAYREKHCRKSGFCPYGKDSEGC